MESFKQCPPSLCHLSLWEVESVVTWPIEHGKYCTEILCLWPKELVIFSFLFLGMLSCVLVIITRRRQWNPTPVLLLEKPHGWRSLVGCSPWGPKVAHNWTTSLSLFTFMHWRRKWQPTPVFLPGESQGQGSLVGCHLSGHTESDTTEAT